MSDKAVITKAQNEIIKSLIEEGKSSIIYTIRQHCEDPYRWSTENLLPLKGMAIDTLITAFYRPEDITVEQTVEDKLLEQYEASLMFVNEHNEGLRSGMRKTLNILGMKVNGINK
ncbi:hypothetical protein MHH28_07835 [Paenibacillus sp. FSL K6-1217]|uniref:hypothetical protein n=1 Tax=Paenibacillus sp. FSL K6-1217 TaxID=2921466 RepID=UPI00324B2C6A